MAEDINMAMTSWYSYGKQAVNYNKKYLLKDNITIHTIFNKAKHFKRAYVTMGDL